MPRGQCRLCHVESDLQLSHILPAFTFRWLRESSGNGHMRSGEEPNRRVQDGLKRYWLCSACEELFSKSETAFANHIFYPYLETPGGVFPYSRWLLHFCTSVSWRVLRLYLDEDHLKSWTKEALSRVMSAESVWRKYLLGQQPHPGVFRQHLLPLDQIAHTTGEHPPNINRYLMRAIHMDICQGSEAIFTYSKMGRFIIIGLVHEPNQTRWRGSKVHATHGYVAPSDYVVPGALGAYLNEKALQMRASIASVSDKQREKIRSHFQSNIDRYIGSDACVATLADIEMFGDEAVAH